MVEGPTHEPQTALLVQVPVVEAVDEFRRVHLAGSDARGIPAHVTVLFPFAPVAAFNADLRRQVAEHFATVEPFAAELTHVGRFEAHVWLAPTPHERFVSLLRDTYARFPSFPPYGDARAEAIPHLTIAKIDAGDSVEEIAGLAARELGPGLPFDFTVDRVTLFEELADGTWRESASFELG